MKTKLSLWDKRITFTKKNVNKHVFEQTDYWCVYKIRCIQIYMSKEKVCVVYNHNT